MNDQRLERILAVSSLLLIILVGMLGIRREAREATNFLNDIVPEGHRAESIDGECFVLYESDSLRPAFYLIKVSAPGYGGDMEVSVLLDTVGIISDMRIVGHRETPSFLEKTEKKGLRMALIGKTFADPFVIGEDVDVISGATYSSEAIISCAQEGSRLLARDQLYFDVPEPEAPGLEIGVPEVSLLALYVLALIGIYRKTNHSKTLRWITMIGGLIILGFWFSLPLTLSKISSFLLGYFPDWHKQLYWYLILGSFVLTLLFTRKNIYCNWICPLGGLQECLGAVGGAKPRFSRRFNRIMKWIQRGVALLAILLALYFRNPVKLNYEIFGVALSLTGATYLFVMTGVFIMTSVFIKRPWCTYLCPILPVEDLLRLLNRKKLT